MSPRDFKVALSSFVVFRFFRVPALLAMFSMLQMIEMSGPDEKIFGVPEPYFILTLNFS